MKKILWLLLSMPLGVVLFYTPLLTAEEPPGPEKPDLSGKKIVMIFASSKFRDEELKEPKKIFEDCGAKVTLASSSLKPARGMLGMMVKADILLKDIKVEEYDAVIFVGGIGAREYFNDKTAHKICKETVEKDKLLGAICIAPAILANCGVLKDKRATVWKDEAQTLKAEGAIYTAKPVEVDGKIITGNGPKAAKEFGQRIAQLLAQKKEE